MQGPASAEAAVAGCDEVPQDRRDPCLRDMEAVERKREAEWDKVVRRYFVPMANRLAAGGDPRMLAVAANLWPRTLGGKADARIRTLRERAFEKGGQDPVVAILLQADTPTEVDAGHVNPLAVPAVKRWQDVEPGNLVPAISSGESIETLLARADTFDRFSLHLSEILSAVDAAFATFPADERQQRALRDLGQDPADLAAGNAVDWSVRAMPAITPLINACKGESRHATPTRNLECRHLGRVMTTRSDSLIGELFGAVLLRYDDVPEVRAEGDALRRRLRWQSKAITRVGRCHAGECTPARMRATPSMGEGDAIRACLTDAGIPLEPPADWDSDAPPTATQ